MSDWMEAHIASISPAAESLIRVALAVPPALAASYLTPGQYVKLGLDGFADGFFAIASRPDPAAAHIELLLKLGAPLTDAVAALAPGAAVRVTGAQGKGFPLDRARGRDLVLVATGSGISPIRSVIETVVGRRSEFEQVSLYFGARTPAAMAYADQLDAWRAAGIDVFPVVSRPSDTGWKGLTGYVQSHLDGVHLKTALAFLCGQKPMVEAVRAALTERGMPAESVSLNF